MFKNNKKLENASVFITNFDTKVNLSLVEKPPEFMNY